MQDCSADMPTKLKKLLFTAVIGAAWLVAIGLGVWILTSYERAPGDAGAPPKSWPVRSRIQLASDRATLVMMAHPQCPCTRASMAELAELMAKVQGKATAYVLFYKPQNSPEDWEKTDLWRSAAAIPGVTVLSDVDGNEARRFGIETSGHTMLFDVKGRLLFSGGITASRGHAGENAGTTALAAMLLDGTSNLSNTLVFGCSLFDSKKQRGIAAWLK